MCDQGAEAGVKGSWCKSTMIIASGEQDRWRCLAGTSEWKGYLLRMAESLGMCVFVQEKTVQTTAVGVVAGGQINLLTRTPQ